MNRKQKKVLWIGFILLALSALQVIFQAAIYLYLYARDGEVSVRFESEMLRTAIGPR